MTMLDGRRDNGATAGATDHASAALLARADWHASGGTLTGKQLAERYDRSARWGQKQRAAAEREAAERAGAGAQADVPRRLNDTRPAAPSPRPAAPSRAPARTGRAGRVSVPLRLLTGAALALVLVVAAVVSYSHIRDLAERAGVGWAGLLPLSLDGMVLACSCSWMVDQRRGRGASVAAKAGVLVGLVASLAANALAVDPGLASLRAVRLALALYPPLALALTIHLATRVLGDD